jgi:hypothetical protein
MSTATASPAADALERLTCQLDLSAIRFKLANPEDVATPTPQQLDVMETEYRKFRHRPLQARR